MTNLNLEQLEQAKKAALLDPMRKSQIKQNLIAMMETEPVRIGILRRLAQYRALSFFGNRNFTAATSAFALAVVLVGAGAGTTFAANESLPGDILYPVKIHVTERMKVAFAISTEAKTEAQLEFLDRRMEEGTQLAAHGKLDAETAAKLEEKIAKHQEKLTEIYNKLSDNEKVTVGSSVSARVEAIINVHAHVLAQFTDDEDNNSFRNNLKKQQVDSNAASTELVATVVVEDPRGDQFSTASLNKISAAEKVLEEASRFVSQTSQKGVAANVQASGQAQLALAQDSLEAARTEHKNAQYKDAFLSANQAIKFAQQARAVVRLGHNLQVDFGVTGDTVIGNGGESSGPGSGDVQGASDNRGSEKSEDKSNNGRGIKLNIEL